MSGEIPRNIELANIPGRRLRLLTPSDAELVPEGETRGIILDEGGAVAIKLAGDSSAITLGSLAVGVVHPLAVKQLMSTGTVNTKVYAVY